jgi:hypothetical protein
MGDQMLISICRGAILSFQNSRRVIVVPEESECYYRHRLMLRKLKPILCLKLLYLI